MKSDEYYVFVVDVQLTKNLFQLGIICGEVLLYMFLFYEKLVVDRALCVIIF